MIFVSVGGQLKFPRLINWVLEWVSLNHYPEQVILQTNEDNLFSKLPNVRFVNKLDSGEFNALLGQCTIFISHAGMGNIINAAKLYKRALYLPRIASLNEHRNDHQLATVLSLSAKYPKFLSPRSKDDFHKCIEMLLFNIAEHTHLEMKNTLKPHIDSLLYGSEHNE